MQAPKTIASKPLAFTWLAAPVKTAAGGEVREPLGVATPRDIWTVLARLGMAVVATLGSGVVALLNTEVKLRIVGTSLALLRVVGITLVLLRTAVELETVETVEMDGVALYEVVKPAEKVSRFATLVVFAIVAVFTVAMEMGVVMGVVLLCNTEEKEGSFVEQGTGEVLVEVRILVATWPTRQLVTVGAQLVIVNVDVA